MVSQRKKRSRQETLEASSFTVVAATLITLITLITPITLITLITLITDHDATRQQ